MIKRRLASRILDALQEFPIVYVAGPRQAGKTTLVRSLAVRAWPAHYITFDDATMLGAAEANPESFLRAWEANLILDEVQLAPGLFRVLKMLVDEARQGNRTNANGRYLLTGSASVMTLPGLADAVVGRMGLFTLYPLSALEISAGKGDFLPRLMGNDFKPGTIKRKWTVVEIMRQATFPEITGQGDGGRRQWFEAYITTILQRDVRQIADIARLGVLPHLLQVLASRVGGLINEADLARATAQNAVTTKNYRILLQMLFLAFDVKPWYRNIGKRLVKAPKGYIMDTSLLCHLLQVDMSGAAIRAPHVFGRLFENFIASELLKQLSSSGGMAQLHHFRTSDNKEVDFVLERPDGRLVGIEAKGRDAVTASDFKGLEALRQQVGSDFICGIVLYRNNKIIPFADRMWAVPVDALWA